MISPASQQALPVRYSDELDAQTPGNFSTHQRPALPKRPRPGGASRPSNLWGGSSPEWGYGWRSGE